MLPALQHRPFAFITPTNWQQGHITLKGLQALQLLAKWCLI
jgi:hypothetical protein